MLLLCTGTDGREWCRLSLHRCIARVKKVKKKKNVEKRA